MLEKTPENDVGRALVELEFKLERHLAAGVAQLLKYPATRHVPERPAHKFDAKRLIFQQLVSRAKSLADAASM